MSKYYEKYLELKEKDKDKLYLFRMGNFYIFLGDDAKVVSDYTTLRLTNLTPGVQKCGFPLLAKDKYMSIFENIHLNIELVDEKSNDLENDNDLLNSYLKKVRKLDINKVTPMKAFELVSELVVILGE